MADAALLRLTRRLTSASGARGGGRMRAVSGGQDGSVSPWRAEYGGFDNEEDEEAEGAVGEERRQTGRQERAESGGRSGHGNGGPGDDLEDELEDGGVSLYASTEAGSSTNGYRSLVDTLHMQTARVEELEDAIQRMDQEAEEFYARQYTQGMAATQRGSTADGKRAGPGEGEGAGQGRGEVDDGGDDEYANDVFEPDEEYGEEGGGSREADEANDDAYGAHGRGSYDGSGRDSSDRDGNSGSGVRRRPKGPEVSTRPRGGRKSGSRTSPRMRAARYGGLPLPSRSRQSAAPSE